MHKLKNQNGFTHPSKKYSNASCHNILYTQESNNPSDKLLVGGFTLIETLIYIGLFAIIIGGALTGVYQIVEGSEKIGAKTIYLEETNFMFQKMDYALTNARRVFEPYPNTTTTELLMQETNWSHEQIIFDVASGTLRMRRNNNIPTPLNSPYISVSSSMFTNIVSATSGHSIQIDLTLSDGRQLQMIKLLKK